MACASSLARRPHDWPIGVWRYVLVDRVADYGGFDRRDCGDLSTGESMITDKERLDFMDQARNQYETFLVHNYGSKFAGMMYPRPTRGSISCIPTAEEPVEGFIYGDIRSAIDAGIESYRKQSAPESV